MKRPRVSIATIGFVVLTSAIDFGWLRWAYNSYSDLAGETVLFLPMIDVLLIVLYRARRRDAAKTSSRLGFLIAGSAATIASFAVYQIFPGAVDATFESLLGPFARSSLNMLTRILGNSAMKTESMEFTVAIVIELLLPWVFFSLPPLFIALMGGWIGRRQDLRRSKMEEIVAPASLIPTG